MAKAQACLKAILNNLKTSLPYVTRFAKTGHNSAFIEIHTIMFWELQAFFCSNIKSVLQSNSQLQTVIARDAIHGFYAFLWQLKLHTFNYTAITYGYVGIQS